jgi:hypothetical protein
VKMRTTTGMLAGAAAIGALVVVPALAQEPDVPQTDVTANAKVIPSKAGTVKKPQGAKITIDAKLTTQPGFDPPVVTDVDILFSQGADWNGANYKTCTATVLNRKGPKACPKESIMGQGYATAKADTVDTRINLLIVNGGANRVLAYATMTNPARVQTAIVVRSTRQSGKWRHRERFSVPKSLQVVAGIPIQPTSLHLTVGGKSYARNYITTTSCPKGGWKYHGTVNYLYDLTGATATDTVSGSIACTS